MKFILLYLLVFTPTNLFSKNVTMLEIENEVNKINNLRENLVKGVISKPNQDTFKAVCKPVGLGIKSYYKATGIMIRQTSLKYRNQKNKPTAFEEEISNLFLKDPSIQESWIYTDHKKHFFKKILIQKPCLVCHGKKDNRPSFIKNKYPNDHAYNFRVGDFRGLYHVEVERQRN